MKTAAALVAAAALVVASGITPAPEVSENIDSQIFSPTPVVMTVEEIPDAITEEKTEEEETKKKSFFLSLKMAIYGFLAACTAWILHKIPWKKIFNKRNLYILLAVICLGLAAYFLCIGE